MDNTVNGTGSMGSGNRNMGGNMGEKKAVGPVIGLILIIVLIILGGVYFWTTKTPYSPQNGDTAATNGNTTFTSETILEQSSSDEPNDIEADLNAFGESDINSLDSGL